EAGRKPTLPAVPQSFLFADGTFAQSPAAAQAQTYFRRLTVFFFNTHAGKSVLFIIGAVIVLAVPLILPWVAAIVLLQMGVKHITLAFRELDHDVPSHAGIAANGPSLPPPGDGERVLTVPGRSLVRYRS